MVSEIESNHSPHKLLCGEKFVIIHPHYFENDIHSGDWIFHQHRCQRNHLGGLLHHQEHKLNLQKRHHQPC